MIINFKDKSQLILFITAVITVFLIFFQSSLNSEDSHKESSAVGDAIEDIVENIKPPSASAEDQFKINTPFLRKLAHFVEHGILGLEIFFLARMIEKNKGLTSRLPLRPLSLLLSLYFGMSIALFDETVQIFSARGHSVKDIWIDIFGYSTVTVLLFAIFLLTSVLKSKASVSNTQES